MTFFGGVGFSGIRANSPFPQNNLLAWWDFTNPRNTLDADQQTTIAYVLDKTANGRHLEQSIKAKQPTYTAGQGAYFETDKYLQMVSSKLSGWLNGSGAWTIAGLVKSNITTATQYILFTGTDLSATNARFGWYHTNTGTAKDLIRLHHTNDSVAVNTLPATQHTNNTAKSHIVKVNLTGNAVDFYVANSSKGQTTPYGGTGNTLENSTPLIVSVGNISAGTTPLNGYIRDLMVWNGIIDEATRALVESYLASRVW